MEQRRKRRRDAKKVNPNIAIYLDELDLTDEEEFYEELDKEIAREERRKYRQSKNASSQRQKQRKQRTHKVYDEYTDEYEDIYYNRKKRERVIKKEKPNKKKKPKRRRRRLWHYVLTFILIIQIPMFYGIFSSFRWQNFSTKSSQSHTKGILLLGVDNDGGSIDNGHTDSITYLAANFQSNEAIALPIYRDANIMQRCTGTSDNINRIYRNNGITCLVESTSDLLGLPVDYYAIVTIHGLIAIIDGMGSVEITPTGSYCSDYGEDGVNYCFEAGQTQEMTGPQALAYIRYRGGHSGENRANRQMELIMAIKNKCMENMLACYAQATPHLSQGVRTNIPLTELLDVAKIFTNSFQMENLEVLQGTNTTNDSGWTQYVSEYDLQYKTDIIRTRIFS